MFDMFDLFISSDLHILITLGSSHPYIFMPVCTYFYPCILTSSYPQVHIPSLASQHLIFSGLLVTSYHHTLLSLGSCTLCACWYPSILTSSHPHIFTFMYSGCLLASSYPHILTFMYYGFLLISSYPHILISSRFSVSTCLEN